MLKCLSLAHFFACSDYRARARRSTLGAYWGVLGFLVFGFGIGLVWGGVLGIGFDPSFILRSLAGYAVWLFFINTVLRACSIYSVEALVVFESSAGIDFLPLKVVLLEAFNFSKNLVVCAFFIGYFSNFVALINFFGVAVIFIPTIFAFLISVSYLVAILGARFSDLGVLIGQVAPALFFMTPVLFEPDALGSLSIISALNPLTYLLGIIRSESVFEISTVDLGFALAFSIVLASLVFGLFKWKKHMVAVWVS